MVNFLVQMKLSKFQNNLEITLKIMKNTWKFTKKNLEKSWKSHGILSVRKKAGTLKQFYPKYTLRNCSRDVLQSLTDSDLSNESFPFSCHQVQCN